MDGINRHFDINPGQVLAKVVEGKISILQDTMLRVQFCKGREMLASRITSLCGDQEKMPGVHTEFEQILNQSLNDPERMRVFREKMQHLPDTLQFSMADALRREIVGKGMLIYNLLWNTFSSNLEYIKISCNFFGLPGKLHSSSGASFQVTMPSLLTPGATPSSPAAKPSPVPALPGCPPPLKSSTPILSSAATVQQAIQQPIPSRTSSDGIMCILCDPGNAGYNKQVHFRNHMYCVHPEYFFNPVRMPKVTVTKFRNKCRELMENELKLSLENGSIQGTGRTSYSCIYCTMKTFQSRSMLVHLLLKHYQQLSERLVEIQKLVEQEQLEEAVPVEMPKRKKRKVEIATGLLKQQQVERMPVVTGTFSLAGSVPVSVVTEEAGARKFMAGEGTKTYVVMGQEAVYGKWEEGLKNTNGDNVWVRDEAGLYGGVEENMALKVVGGEV